MDFTKFIATLEYSGLFFPRCRQFPDPFEGSFPRGNYLIRQDSLSALGLTPEQVSERLRTRSALYKSMQHWVVANCWHMGAYESAALWSLYSRPEMSSASFLVTSACETAYQKRLRSGKSSTSTTIRNAGGREHLVPIHAQAALLRP